jgi:hypothetical protein
MASGVPNMDQETIEAGKLPAKETGQFAYSGKLEAAVR